MSRIDARSKTKNQSESVLRMPRTAKRPRHGSKIQAKCGEKDVCEVGARTANGFLFNYASSSLFIASNPHPFPLFLLRYLGVTKSCVVAQRGL